VINFRFHIVSLIAVFLALAVGVVMGSTVIDKVTVDQLRTQLDRVEKKDDAVRTANEELGKEVAALQGFIDQAVPLLNGRRLAGANIAVVAIRGADGGAVRATVETLRNAGARVPGVLWLEPAWTLSDHDGADKLAKALAVPPAFTTAPTTGTVATTTTAKGARASSTTLPPAVESLRSQGLRELAARLVKAPRSTADVLGALQDNGFVGVDGEGQPTPELSSIPLLNMRVVVIGGNDERKISQAVAAPFVTALSEDGAPVVFAEAFRAAGKAFTRGDVVDDVRRSQTLAAKIPTVDDVDTVQGRTALVLSLEEFARGVVGHYGTGRGAKRQLPQPAATP
jgi:hypothetical protein